MKAKILALLLSLFLFSPAQAESQAKANVFVNTKIKKLEACKSNPVGNSAVDAINSQIMIGLVKAGFGIAESREMASNRVEVNVKISWCGVRMGEIEIHSANITIMGLSDGTSVASSTAKHVPFSYSSELTVVGGPPSGKYESEVIAELKRYVDIFMSNTF